MAVILRETDISALKDALRPGASPDERNSAIAALDDATRAPDEIEIYRAIKEAGARKRIDVARAVCALWHDPQGEHGE